MPDTTDAEGLTVGQVCARLGVTVRALHHWDEIGLARPSLRTPAGYRLYTADDLERLHRIVVYRELGLGLDRIRAVLDDSTADVPAALRAQRSQLTERIARLRQLSAGLDRMIEAHERGRGGDPPPPGREIGGPGGPPRGGRGPPPRRGPPGPGPRSSIPPNPPP
ncbi:MerR family transcriptional regulator [Nocardia wallacei]|uniref:MerR family transcriptional regulator n=1 Tax=Nocardia wallacei TaxID=480035 RepID=UPI002455BB8F|nr:MerR family transcriptional regulator [Nocardia wallacei]